MKTVLAVAVTKDGRMQLPTVRSHKQQFNAAEVLVGGGDLMVVVITSSRMLSAGAIMTKTVLYRVPTYPWFSYPWNQAQPEVPVKVWLYIFSGGRR